MNVFYGGAIQGVRDRTGRIEVHRFLIDAIKAEGFRVPTQHTTSRNREEATKMFEKEFGKIPREGIERTIYGRNKPIDIIEGDIVAAIFEVSVPGLGTGIELAHAYLRPRMRLKEIPVLALYEKDYWPNNLSTMIRGITKEKVPSFTLKEYTSLEEAKEIVKEFLKNVGEN